MPGEQSHSKKTTEDSCFFCGKAVDEKNKSVKFIFEKAHDLEAEYIAYVEKHDKNLFFDTLQRMAARDRVAKENPYLYETVKIPRCFGCFFRHKFSQYYPLLAIIFSTILILLIPKIPTIWLLMVFLLIPLETFHYLAKKTFDKLKGKSLFQHPMVQEQTEKRKWELTYISDRMFQKPENKVREVAGIDLNCLDSGFDFQAGLYAFLGSMLMSFFVCTFLVVFLGIETLNKTKAILFEKASLDYFLMMTIYFTFYFFRYLYKKMMGKKEWKLPV